MFYTKRIYEQAQPGDGYRILVDRLWPRGISRANARIDLWLKDIGPSNELRKWFGHDPAKWLGFQRRYIQELRAKPELIRQVKSLEKEHGKVTLLFSAKDITHNQAIVLRMFLRGKK